MTRALAAAALLLASCAAPPPGPEAFSFAVLGDAPYSAAEERAFLAMMRRIDREPVDFVLHVGDFKGGGDCSDALFAQRRAEFDASAHPFIYTPGDNEWTDCHKPYMGSRNGLERLARLREVFFAEPRSLGSVTFPTAMQTTCTSPPPGACGCAYPENRRWTRHGVVFATLNVPGSENNVGLDAAGDAEARCRDAANSQWLDAAVAEAAAPGARALVVAIQADPWVETKRPVYKALLAQLESTYGRLGKPVLLIHGDTHTYRADWPFNAPIARLETYGSPFVGWVKVTVDPSRRGLFSFEPRLQAFVPP